MLEPDRPEPAAATSSSTMHGTLGEARIGELHRQLAVARSAVAQRNMLMTVAGHDLKQPLQIISRALERLTPYANGNADIMWAEAAGLQIARLAQGLTNLATAGGRADDRIGQPEPRCFPVADLLDALGRTWWMDACAKGLELRILRSSAQIVSDPELLETVMGNLIGNAIKYTRSGKIVVGCRKAGQMLHLVVADRGQGIADVDKSRIFTPFEQIDPEAAGLGLGLYLVRSLCETLGHELRLNSRLGHGTTFYVTVATP